MTAQAIENQQRARVTSTNQHKKKHLVMEFDVGQLVMLRDPNKRRGKLDPRFQGPFEIIEKIEPLVYKIKHRDSQREFTRHIESLKLYHQRDPSVNANIGLTMAINSVLLLLLMFSSANATFNRQPSVMWNWASKTVFDRIEYFDIVLIYRSPCDSLALASGKISHSKVEVHHDSGTKSESANLHEGMVAKCNNIYTQLWETAVAEMLDKCQGQLDGASMEEMSKRNVVTAVVAGLSAVCFTDLVGCLWSYINPNSDYNRINRIETKIDTITQDNWAKLDAFKNVTTHIYNTFNSSIGELNRQKQEFHQLVTDLPEFIFGSNHIFNFIKENTRRIQDIKFKCHSNVDVLALSELVKLPILSQLSEEDTNWVTIQAIKPEALRFIFKSKRPSTDTHIIRAEGFPIWNITSKPATLLKYTGSQYFIYNRTANCASPIDLPPSHIVYKRCDARNFVSAHLQQWEVVKKTNKIASEPQITTIKEAGSSIWVYCFPGFILINDRNVSCPSYVFSIPAETSFATSDISYQATRLRDRKTSMLDVQLGASFVHADMPSDQSMASNLEELHEAIDLVNKEGPLVSLEEGHQWSLLTITSLTSIISLCLLSAILWKKWMDRVTDRGEFGAVPLNQRHPGSQTSSESPFTS